MSDVTAVVLSIGEPYTERAIEGLGACMALVGMCHGLFYQRGRDAEADEAYASLAEILAVGAPW